MLKITEKFNSNTLYSFIFWLDQKKKSFYEGKGDNEQSYC